MENKIKYSWIKTGIVCGFLTAIVFPVMAFVDLPVQLTFTLAASFGIFLIIASIGLYHILSIHKNSMSLQLAGLFNIIAGTVVVLMFTVQLGLFSEGKNYGEDVQKEVKTYVFKTVNLTQLSLDVVWDLFISLGTILFAFNMLSHPKLGKIIGGIGILLGAGLLILNIYTFPIPPGEAGSIDLGPFVALWYLAVTIMMAISLRWVRESLQVPETN
jgi:hypothetical protein